MGKGSTMARWARWCRESEAALMLVWLIPTGIGAVLIDRLT